MGPGGRESLHRPGFELRPASPRGNHETETLPAVVVPALPRRADPRSPAAKASGQRHPGATRPPAPGYPRPGRGRCSHARHPPPVLPRSPSQAPRPPPAGSRSPSRPHLDLGCPQGCSRHARPCPSRPPRPCGGCRGRGWAGRGGAGDPVTGLTPSSHRERSQHPAHAPPHSRDPDASPLPGRTREPPRFPGSLPLLILTRPAVTGSPRPPRGPAARPAPSGSSGASLHVKGGACCPRGGFCPLRHPRASSGQAPCTGLQGAATDLRHRTGVCGTLKPMCHPCCAPFPPTPSPHAHCHRVSQPASSAQPFPQLNTGPGTGVL